MLSNNIILRQAYFAALNNIIVNSISIPVFWNELPATEAPGLYIIFGQIRNVDASNKGASVTQTFITVSIFTNSLKYSDGVALESAANEVLNRIYKNPQYKLPLNSQFFEVIKTTLQSDVTNNFTQDRQNVYIDRILTFQHTIFQNVS